MHYSWWEIVKWNRNWWHRCWTWYFEYTLIERMRQNIYKGSLKSNYLVIPRSTFWYAFHVCNIMIVMSNYFKKGQFESILCFRNDDGIFVDLLVRCLCRLVSDNYLITTISVSCQKSRLIPFVNMIFWQVNKIIIYKLTWWLNIKMWW